MFAAANDDRLRRKSGDDAGLFGSPGRHKTLGSAHIFEAFRPRSKSDAQRAIKKPTIMTTVKNAVQVSSITSHFNISQKNQFLPPDSLPCDYESFGEMMDHPMDRTCEKAIDDRLLGNQANPLPARMCPITFTN